MAVNIKKDYGKQRKPDVTSLIFGKIPPQAAELEEAVLGAIMLEPDKLGEVMGILQADECFYVDAHQKIYAAIRRLHSRTSPVDLLTVTDELRKSEELELAGGAYYITRLTMAVLSSAHVESHARIVQEKYMKRELIRMSGETIANAYDETVDVFDLIDAAEGQMLGISSGNLRTPYVKAKQLADIAMKHYRDRVDNPKEVAGISSGYRALDVITNGWRPGNLIIIGAQSSVGKTSFALNLAINAALANIGVAFFSLEMENYELMNRILAAMSHVDHDKIEKGNMDEYEQHDFYKAVADFRKLNFIIDDAPGLNAMELRRKGRKMVGKDEIEMIIVDYLQLMHATIAKGGNREQEVAQITRDLKSLAKELRIPIIALSQLNRATDKNSGSNGKPQLSNLRESGAIEQDANIVLFLTRPSYQKSEDEIDPSIMDDADIHVAKNRGGKSGDQLTMKMVKSIQKWFDPNGYDNYKGISPWVQKPTPDQSFTSGIASAGRHIVDYSQPREQEPF